MTEKNHRKLRNEAFDIITERLRKLGGDDRMEQLYQSLNEISARMGKEIDELEERKLKAESRILELIIERDKELRAEGERAEELMEERKWKYL